MKRNPSGRSLAGAVLATLLLAAPAQSQSIGGPVAVSGPGGPAAPLAATMARGEVVVGTPSVACAGVTLVVGPPCTPLRHPTVIRIADPARPREAADPLAAYSRPPAPASNPLVAPLPARPPSGWVQVWDDGRINFRRGLPPRYRAPLVVTEVCACR